MARRAREALAHVASIKQAKTARKMSDGGYRPALAYVGDYAGAKHHNRQLLSRLQRSLGQLNLVSFAGTLGACAQ